MGGVLGAGAVAWGWVRGCVWAGKGGCCKRCALDPAAVLSLRCGGGAVQVKTDEDGRGRFKSTSDKPLRIADREKKAALKT